MKTGRMQLPRKHKGFTLIEIAIVLVIIGLLLGGVLQGQQLIENSRVKQAVNTFNGLGTAALAYQERYGRLPGDDAGAVLARGPTWPAAAAPAASNGVINALVANTFTGVGETGFFFQNLRSAGFITGNPALALAAALPQNPFGGAVGITTDPVNGALNGTKICMNNVGGTAAIALDTQLDDGLIATGRVRSTLIAGGALVPSGAAAAGVYGEQNTYIVCNRIM